MSSSENLSPELSLAQNGKSFHWASRFLGVRIGKDAAQLYSFCRILDDMADGDIADGPDRLVNIRVGLLDQMYDKDPILANLGAFINQNNISAEVLVALIDGLLQDQNEVALADEATLLRYAYRVAGTVGLMMCNILGCNDRLALAHAIDLGIAMQLTNIARDVHEDALMGRRYLPGNWVNNMSPVQILAAGASVESPERAMVSEAVSQLLQLAETYYESGTAGLVYLPARAHLAISVAGQVYRQIGLQVSAKGCRWYAGREVTSQTVKFACSVKAVRRLSDRWYAAPQHAAMLHAPLIGLPYVG